MSPYNLLKNARRVEQQQWYGGNAANGGNYGNGGYGNNNNYNNGGQDANEANYLMDYSLSLVSCLQDEQSLNYESGEVEQSTVIFRLCPKDTCLNSTDALPCDSGYGDFAIGINSFAQAYAESVKDNYNNGMNAYSYGYGEFNVEEYTRECKLYEGNREGGANNNNNYNGYGYNAYAYVGLACTSDGKDIRLATFSDQVSKTNKQQPRQPYVGGQHQKRFTEHALTFLLSILYFVFHMRYYNIVLLARIFR